MRVKNCRETVGSQFLPRGIKMSRRALWVLVPSFRFLVPSFEFWAVQGTSAKTTLLETALWRTPNIISGLQKGPAERGHVKKRQKSSKSVKKFFDTFRQFSRRAKNVKNRQKVSKSFFDTFRHFSRGTFFPAPFAIR